jgi:hypothetical protein
MEFKQWLFITENEDHMQITPHGLEDSNVKKIGFLYCIDHQFYFNSTHDAACADIPKNKRDEWGITSCDGEREQVNAKCLAGRLGVDLSQKVLLPALIQSFWQTRAQQIKGKTGQDVKWYDLKYAWETKAWDHSRKHHDISYLDPRHKNYLFDPETKEDMLKTSGFRDKIANLVGSTVISFWNDPTHGDQQNALYAELLKPCLQKLIDIIPQRYLYITLPASDKIFVSIPHHPMRSADYYLKSGWTSGRAAPSKLSQLEQEEMAAIHTGSLRGKFLSPEEKNALRAKYGMATPVSNATPEDNYEKWKKHVGD